MKEECLHRVVPLGNGTFGGLCESSLPTTIVNETTKALRTNWSTVSAVTTERALSLRQPRPEHAIERREAKAWAAGATRGDQLMPQRDDLQMQRCA